MGDRGGMECWKDGEIEEGWWRVGDGGMEGQRWDKEGMEVWRGDGGIEERWMDRGGREGWIEG